MQPAEGKKEKPRVLRGFKCHPGKNRGLRVKPGLAGRGVGLLRNGHGERREGTGGDGRAGPGIRHQHVSSRQGAYSWWETGVNLPSHSVAECPSYNRLYEEK